MPRKKETSSDVNRKIETLQREIIQSYDSLQNAQDLYNSYKIRKQQENHQAFKEWTKLLKLQGRFRSLVNAERIAAETSEQAASGVEENNTSEGEPSSRALDEAAGNLSPAFDSLRLADNDDGEGDIQMIALGTGVNNLAETNGMSSGSNRESIAIRERELGLDEDASADELSVVEENVICNQCQNCRRKQYTASGLYYMTFVQVQSNQISSRFYRNKDVPVSNSENTAVPLNLCNECWVHLRKDQPVNQDDMQLEDDREGVEAAVGEGTTSASNTKTDEKQSSFKYTAFAFLWDLLSGYCKSSTIESYHFYDVYGETLWQIIPRSMRPWWIDEIKVINSRDSDNPRWLFRRNSSERLSFGTTIICSTRGEIIGGYLVCCNVLKRKKKYSQLPPKEAVLIPWHTVCVDLTGPYTIEGEDGTCLEFMCMTMIDPATGWFEVVELPTVATASLRARMGRLI
eukprot:scaffold1995_cov119-Skeletonema_dohrnii-CCMP3373.AAC.3